MPRNSPDPTDLNELRRIAAEKEEENWRFRTHLKQSSLCIDELDAIVHRLNDEFSAAIDCTACGNCCRTCRPVLNESDIDRLAGHLQMAPGEFTGRHLRQEKEEGGWEFAELPCPFLQDNLCTVYEHRPDDCRSYPHLHKNDTIFRLAGIVMNCEVCPIVFNVFEELKNRIP